MTSLFEPVRFGSATARNRLVFGPHETNLARHRAISERHVAYYRERAAGGAGVIVVEEASVHDSDWPYERAPLAADCAQGWLEVARSCHDEGALVIAGLGHAGGQGSSAYHQRALLAPSSVPDVVTREVGKAMEAADIEDVLAGFAISARLALDSGCDGVEINAGQWSLIRQFCSGLTNQRKDGYGTDRSLFVRRVIDAVRSAIPSGVVGLRFSCDELAPWAGLVPEHAATQLGGLAGAGQLDYVTVVRGSAYGTGATRPDGHVDEGFNEELAALVRQNMPNAVAVVAQGSVVAPDMAEALVASGKADLVEVTRAFIADSDLGSKLLRGEAARVRPCVLCNQACQVRDARNPIVTCITDPRSGYESVDPKVVTRSTGTGGAADGGGSGVLVVGGGPAGLECARVAALLGLRVTVFEREDHFGGMVLAASRVPGRHRLERFTQWLEAECRILGVALIPGHEVTLEELDAHDGPVVCCTGSRPGRRTYSAEAFAPVLSAAEVLVADRLVGEAPPSPVLVWDPIGGPIGVGTAELLACIGSEVTLVTPDFVVGEQLARSGDLAPAGVRLQQAGVSLLKRSVVTAAHLEAVVVKDRDSGDVQNLEVALLVDAGHRLPEDTLYKAVSGVRPVFVAGDAVAPRSVLEAVLEGRRVAALLAVEALVGVSQ